MATSGFFTYHDLYGGKPEIYHHQNPTRFLSSDTTQTLPVSNTTTETLSTTLAAIEFNSSTTIASDGKLNKFVQLIPFAYFHWFLIGLALFLASLLTIIFTYYCRSYCRKNKKTSDDKKQPLPSFYRCRKVKQPGKVSNVYEPTSPFPFPSPMRPCPSQSIDRRNNRLLREGLNAVGSPRVPRTDVSQSGPSSSFSSSASDLLAEIKNRLSTHSSKPSPEANRPYETQRAQMVVPDDVKHSSLLVDIN